MLFKDILDKIREELQPEFEKLFNEILKNQSHENDLLLVYINGFYNPEVFKWDNISPPLSPFMSGPNKEGFSEQLHYDFIHNYRSSYFTETPYQEYLDSIKWNPEKKNIIEEAKKFEDITIQLEMLIYLKIWESDAFIKKLYQIARLVNGENYDWYFKIQESNQGKQGTTGKRHEIIRRKIRDRFTKSFPNIYNSFKTSYITQIRNSIAHSQYWFLNRHIHPSNYVEEDPNSQMKSLSFDEWAEIFHSTLMIHNSCIWLTNTINEFYGQKALANNNELEVRITNDNNEEMYFTVIYRPEYEDWGWKSSN